MVRHSGAYQGFAVENDVADWDFEVFEEGAESRGAERVETGRGCVVVDSGTHVAVVEEEELVGDAVVVLVAVVDIVVAVAVGHVELGKGMAEAADRDTVEAGTEQASQPRLHPDSTWMVRPEEHTDPETTQEGHHQVGQY